MHPSVLYHHTTALSHKAHHVIAPFYGQPLPICRGHCSPLSEKRNKNAVFLHIRERQHSSLSVQIFAVAGNHIFIPSKGLFPVPCRRPVRVSTDQEKPTCNSHQFQESRRFVILIANLFFASAAFFAPVILSRIRYPAAPVCKMYRAKISLLKQALRFYTKPGKWPGPGSKRQPKFHLFRPSITCTSTAPIHGRDWTLPSSFCYRIGTSFSPFPSGENRRERMSKPPSVTVNRSAAWA